MVHTTGPRQSLPATLQCTRNLRFFSLLFLGSRDQKAWLRWLSAQPLRKRAPEADSRLSRPPRCCPWRKQTVLKFPLWEVALVALSLPIVTRQLTRMHSCTRDTSTAQASRPPWLTGEGHTPRKAQACCEWFGSHCTSSFISCNSKEIAAGPILLSHVWPLPLSGVLRSSPPRLRQSGVSREGSPV